MSKSAIQVIGRLGNDAIIKEVPSGKKVIEFSVAISERSKNKEGVKTETTTWVKCAWWTEKTDIAQWLKKGGLIEASGIPRVSAYLKDGLPIASQEMIVNSVTLLGGSPQNSAPQPTQAQQEQQIPSQPKEEFDNLPF